MKHKIKILQQDIVMDDMEEVRPTHITRTGGLSPTGPRTMDTKARTPLAELLTRLQLIGSTSDITMDMSAQSEYLNIEEQILTRIDERIDYHTSQVAAHNRLDGYVLKGHNEQLTYFHNLKGRIMKGVYNKDNDTQTD